MFKSFISLLVILFSIVTYAQDRSYNIYFDKDNNESTGCPIPQPDFLTTFPGIEGYIQVITTGSPPVIATADYVSCNSGVFDAGVPVVNAAIGFNTSDLGHDLVEAEILTSDLGIQSSTQSKLYISAETVQSTDIVTASTNGSGLLVGVAFAIPTLSVFALILLSVLFLFVAKKVFNNKVLLASCVVIYSSVVWAMVVFVIDGQTDDWVGINAVASDPVGDNTGIGQFADITQVFVHIDQQKFTARIDVLDMENVDPTITTANNVSVAENQTAVIDVNSSDVEGDTEGAGLTYALTGTIDDALFTIDTNTGIITFLVAPDFESPGDFDSDNDYEVQVTVTDSGALTGVQDIVVTVTNDVVDDSSITFQAASSNTTNENTALNVVVTLNALAPLTAPLSVDVVDAGGGTAIDVTDYNSVGTQTVTFPMGATDGTTMNATVTPVNDNNVENNETVNLQLQNISGPGLMGAQTTHTVTITEDDVVTVEFISANSATVNESTALDVVARLNLPGGGQLDVAVSADAVDAGGGTATGATDYTAFGIQTVTFAVGSVNAATQNTTLTPVDDPASEGNETVNLALQNVTGAPTASLGAQSTHQVTITDDEASLEFALASSNTVDESATPFNVIVELSTPIPLVAPIMVDVTDAGGGSAISATDYTAVGTQTLIFPMGSTNGTTMNAVLTPIVDTDVENHETVNLMLGNLVGIAGLGSQTSHTVTIVNDDTADVQFSLANSATINESTALNVAVRLDVPGGGSTAVVIIADVIDAGTGSATSGGDYSAFGTQMVTFPLGSVNGAVQSVVLTPLDDPTTEGDEKVDLMLQNVGSNPSVTLGGQTTHTATITDDENTAPTAVVDAYNVTGNVGISVAAGAGVLFNDTDPEMDMLVVSAVGADVTAPFTGMTMQGGSVTVQANGSFTYDPPAGFTGADGFTYTVSDGSLTDTGGTVSLAVANKIWFIDASAGAGTGTLASPFNTVAAFNAVNNGTGTNPAAGECVFIETGAYTGPLTLLANQKVIGQGSSQAIATTCGITLATHSSTLPTINGTRPTLTSVGNGINLATGNTLRGFNIGNAPNKLIGNNFGTLTITEMALTGTGKGVDLTTGTAAITFDSINTLGSASEGIDLNGVSGSFTVTGNVSVTTPASAGISIANSNGIFNFSGVSKTVNSGAITAVNLTSNSGATINFTNGGLDIDSTSGTGFNATGGGTVSVQGSGNTINATTGVGISIVNTTIGATNVTFQSVSTNGGVDPGIILNNTGISGGFVVTGDGTGVQNGSGGLIQNVDGDGISLTNTSNVSITQLNLTNNADDSDGVAADDHGIDIDSVTNFTYQDAIIDGFGTAVASYDDQHSISILNLFGTSLIDNVTFNDINEDGIEYINNTTDDGIQDVLTVSNSLFNNHLALNGESGIQAEAEGTSNMGLIVNNTDFNINANGALGVLFNSTGSSASSLTVNNGSTFTAINSFGAGTIQTNNTGTSTGIILIDGIVVTGAPFNGLNILNNDDATSNVTIQNSQISGDGTMAQNGFGVRISQDMNGVVNALIDNNNIGGAGTFGFDSIRLEAGDTTDNTGRLNATVTSNITVAPNDIGAGLNAVVSENNTICVDVRSNTLVGSETFPGFGFDDDVIFNASTAGATIFVEQTSTANVLTLNPPTDTIFSGGVGAVTFSGGNCVQP